MLTKRGSFTMMKWWANVWGDHDPLLPSEQPAHVPFVPGHLHCRGWLASPSGKHAGLLAVLCPDSFPGRNDPGAAGKAGCLRPDGKGGAAWNHTINPPPCVMPSHSPLPIHPSQSLSLTGARAASLGLLLSLEVELWGVRE